METYVGDLRERIDDDLPSLRQSCDIAFLASAKLAGLVVESVTCPEAIKIIFVQAFNDFSDLMTDLQGARGRSSIRAARALIEHAINMATVLDSSDAAERYLDHLNLMPMLLHANLPGTSDSETFKRFKAKLKKTFHGARRRFESAQRRWGSGFRRSWHATNLHDRAAQHGLAKQYEWYRVCSLVAHGAAGGSFGSTKGQHSQGNIVYRLGNSLSLAPLAYWIGVDAFLKLLGIMDTRLAFTKARDFAEPVHELLLLWPRYQEIILRYDKEAWPAHLTRSLYALVSIDSQGNYGYYAQDTLNRTIAPAHPIVLSDGEATALEQLRNAATSHPSEYYPPLGVIAVALTQNVAVADGRKPISFDTFRPYGLPHFTISNDGSVQDCRTELPKQWEDPD